MRQGKDETEFVLVFLLGTITEGRWSRETLDFPPSNDVMGIWGGLVTLTPGPQDTRTLRRVFVLEQIEKINTILYQ